MKQTKTQNDVRDNVGIAAGSVGTVEKPETSLGECMDTVPTHATIQNARKILITERGGTLRQDGNPGNKGGGRPAERVRIKATEATEAVLGDLGDLLTGLVAEAKQAQAKDQTRKSLEIMREATKLFNGLAALGVGTKIETSVDNPRALGMALEAIEDVYGKDDRYFLIVSRLEEIYKS